MTAVNQLVKLGWHQGELYLEAQPDFAQIDELEATLSSSPRPPTAEERQLIADRAGPEAGRIDWTVADAELTSRRGVPVQITRSGPLVVETPSSPGAAGGGAVPVIVRDASTGGIY